MDFSDVLFRILFCLPFLFSIVFLVDSYRYSDKARYLRALKREETSLNDEDRRICGHLWAPLEIPRHDICPICYYERAHPHLKKKREGKAQAGALSFAFDEAPKGSLTLPEEKK